MNLKTVYTYESGRTEVEVILETELYDVLSVNEHLEAIRKLTNCPKAPTDKEMDDMEAYFSEDE